MRRAHLLVLAFALAFAAAGAGCGSSAEPLTCLMLADPNNCWAKAAAAAAACIPMRQSAVAAMSADRKTCTWNDGVTATFDEALPTDTTAFATSVDHLGMTIQGQGCQWRFVDTLHNRMEFTIDGKTLVSELDPDRTYRLTCGDGHTYETSFDALLKCTTPGSAPTDGFDVDQTMFVFTISYVGASFPMYKCSR